MEKHQIYRLSERITMPELINKISSSPSYALQNPRIISAIFKKCILNVNKPKQSSQLNIDKMIHILTSFIEFDVEKVEGFWEKNKILFERAQKTTYVLLINKLKKQMGYSQKNLKFISYATKNKQKRPALDENKINQWLGMLRSDQLTMANVQCLGCMQVFYKDIPRDLNSYRQKYLVESVSLFQNQQYYTQNICALLNSKGGFLFVTGQSKALSPNKLQGLSLSQITKQKYKSFLDRCIKYIQPTVEEDCYHLDFIPIFSNPIGTDLPAVEWVVRLMIKPKMLKSLYYISYKELVSEKNAQVQFYRLNNKGNVTLMQFDQVYSKIHSFFRTKIHNRYNSNHPGVSCCRPLEVDKKWGSQTPNLNPSPGKINMEGQGSSKFRYTMLIIKQKEGKDDDKKIKQIQRQIINKKILCQVEKIELKDIKTRQWIISFDCPTQVVEQIIKLYNRNGELSYSRAKRCVKVNDDQFLIEKKEERVLERIKLKIDQQGKQSKLEYKVFNTNDMTLNKNSKAPVYFKFKNLRHAILCYSLLYASNRRLEFVDIKH